MNNIHLALSKRPIPNKLDGFTVNFRRPQNIEKEEEVGQDEDADQSEDKDAEVDLNLVMNESLEFIEIQASGEESVFNNSQLTTMLDYGRTGIAQLLEKQRIILQK